jgi:uncharacterized membrane protein
MAQETKDLGRGSAGKRRGWERLLLVVSLGVNLLVAGAIVGGVATHERRQPPPNDVSVGPFTEAFDKADRDALRKAVSNQSTSLREMKQALDADVARLVAALKAEPWDEAVVRAVMSGMRERLEARSEIGEALILARIEDMTVADRQAFAGRLEERMKRGAQGRDGRPPKPEDRAAQ